MSAAAWVTILYAVLGLAFGVWGARRFLDVHPNYDKSRYADYAGVAFFALCLAAIWPLAVVLSGIGWLISIGKPRGTG